LELCAIEILFILILIIVTIIIVIIIIIIIIKKRLLLATWPWGKREKDERTMKKNYARSNLSKFSYFNRMVDLWNSLPLISPTCERVFSFMREISGVHVFMLLL